MSYCIYLRKSRLDIEAEAHGEGETLERHQTMLMNFAKQHQMPISRIYKEVVSGESIDARPEMQQLIEDVENGMWEGVLVIEVERLARGDTIDQGIVSRAFKLHNTKIITPIKTYDPSNEFDEEYFEFGLFMSRREYKVINRRIQRGRIQSAKEGKFLSSVPPYGYDKVKIPNGKGYTLAPNKDEAPIVKMIFEMYLNGTGMSVIASNLDKMGIKPRYRDTWSKSTINDILKNPVYIGKIRWSYKEEKKDRKTGQIHKSFRDNYIYVDGLHPAIISVNDFTEAQSIRKNNTTKRTKQTLALQNPLSGVLHCKKCGALMTRLGPNSHCKYSTLKCSNKYCDNISAPISSVEILLIKNLKDWLNQAEITIEKEYKEQKKNKVNQNSIGRLNNELKTVEKQIQRAFDFLEQGTYTLEIFTERSTVLNNRKKAIEEKIADLEKKNKKIINITEIRERILPKIKALVETYFDFEDAETRNNILKTVLNDSTYLKTTRNTRGKSDIINFDIEIFPKMFSEFQG